MSKRPIYDCADCIHLIKNEYPFIPYWIIKRVLFAHDIYLYSIGATN